MTRALSVLFAIALSSHAAAACGADKGPVRTKLDAAVAAYEAEAKKHRAAVTAWLDKLEETARERGDKEAVDRVKALRKTFADRGILPHGISSTVVEQSRAARARLEAAYQTAIKEFTQAKKDPAATQAEKQLDQFRKKALGVTLAEWVEVRTIGRWRRNHDGQVFVFHADGKVSEFDAGNRPVTVGKWTVGKDGMGRVLLANRWVFTFTLPEESVMSAPAWTPRGRREGPWGLKRIEK